MMSYVQDMRPHCVGLHDATSVEKLQQELELESVITKVRQTELIKNNSNTQSQRGRTINVESLSSFLNH